MVTCSAHESVSTLFATDIKHLSPEVQTEQEKAEQSIQHLLIARASQGDQKAFEAIANQYSTIMLRTALMIIGDHDCAEDIVQDALIQVWNHLSDLRNASALRPWLLRIVVNQCISCKRSLNRSTMFKRQVLSEQEIDLTAQIAADQQGCLERKWDLAQAVASLPIKQRIVIVLHYYHGMTLPEMARTLATSENTLKKRIQAALTNLRRLLLLDDSPTPYTFEHLYLSNILIKDTILPAA